MNSLIISEEKKQYVRLFGYLVMKTISVTVANQQFLKVIQDVERGEVFLITRRGEPIATLMPRIVAKTENPRWNEAYSRMIAQLN